MKRMKTNNKLFLELCRKGAPDAEILERMGWKVKTAKSKKDPTKRVRALRWTAIHKGLNVDGKTIFLKLKDAKSAPRRPSKKKVAPKPAEQPEGAVAATG